MHCIRFIHSVQEMSKYRSKGDLGAQTDLERDNTEHILDQQSRVRVRGLMEQPKLWKDGNMEAFAATMRRMHSTRQSHRLKASAKRIACFVVAALGLKIRSGCVYLVHIIILTLTDTGISQLVLMGVE